MQRRSSRLMSRPWLIDLLLVVAIVGIALALWRGEVADEREGSESFATDRIWIARSQMEQVGLAMFSWLTDQVALGAKQNLQAVTCAGGVQLDIAGYTPISHQDLEQLLVPSYIAALPELDPWGNPYDYRLNLDDLLGSSVAAIRSAGAGGSFSGDLYGVGFTSSSSEDLVWADGFFIRQPPQLGPVHLQDRSQEDIRNLGIAWFSWLVDNLGFAPRSPDSTAPLAMVDVSAMTQVSHAELVAMLIPSANFYYVRCIPELDAWGNPYEFFMNDNLFATQQVLAIRSAGADGVFEGVAYTSNTFPADDFARDLVWADGVFVQSPDGQHRLIFADDFETGELWGFWSCTGTGAS